MTEHRSRGDFVMTDRKAAAELRRRLRATPWPASTQGRALQAAHILLLEANYRDDGVGHVAGTRTEIWQLLGITDKTAKVIREVLAYVGLLHPGRDDFDITRAAYAWLTKGEPAPPSLGEMQRDPAHALWLFAEAEPGATERLTADEIRNHSGSRDSEPLRVEVGATPSRTRSHSESATLSPAETPPKEVKKERTPLPPTPSGAPNAREAEVAKVINDLERRVRGAQNSLPLAQAVQQLLEADWQLCDVAPAVLAGLNRPGVGLLVTKARSLLGTESPRHVEAGVADRAASRDAALDCEHGTPHGTWDGDGRHGPVWLECAQCRAAASVVETGRRAGERRTG